MTKITPKEKFDIGNRIRLDKSLSPTARLVGLHIADHINTTRGYAWIPQGKIARDLGISERAVRDAIKDLALAHHFDIDRSRRQHEYRPPTPAKNAGIAPTTPRTPANFSTTPAKNAAHTGKLCRPSFLHPIKHPLKEAENLNSGRKKRRNLSPEQAKKYLDECEILASGTDAERQQLRIERPQLQLIAADEEFYPAEDRDRASRIVDLFELASGGQK